MENLTNKDKKRAREYAYLIMYQVDVSGFSPEEIAETFWEELEEERGKEKKEVKELSERLVKGAVRSLLEVDSEISKHLKKGWIIDRLLPMDRSILRVAAYELLKENISPPAVVINDAVDLAKVYGEDENSYKFINAVLDKIKKDAEK
ncbi:NusB antitermination factor [Balnearium lithotrophicum]|uniref:Transcription antitermination protein NusB n=1 Tax=Balnearium lithotrophicum TaxID=223788 RepID=A0A521B2H4_9BACT|nr:transcription antitermination factor NusB [Balnearium lithotrophicum]SMO41287.1 NusB antitermination factor [Balnearium lithotrophicum]